MAADEYKLGDIAEMALKLVNPKPLLNRDDKLDGSGFFPIDQPERLSKQDLIDLVHALASITSEVGEAMELRSNLKHAKDVREIYDRAEAEAKKLLVDRGGVPLDTIGDDDDPVLVERLNDLVFGFGKHYRDVPLYLQREWHEVATEAKAAKAAEAKPKAMAEQPARPTIN